MYPISKLSHANKAFLLVCHGAVLMCLQHSLQAVNGVQHNHMHLVLLCRTIVAYNTTNNPGFGNLGQGITSDVVQQKLASRTPTDRTPSQDQTV